MNKKVEEYRQIVQAHAIVQEYQQEQMNGVDIYCLYCKDYLCFTVETPCHHIFCQKCIEEYLLFINQCPECKQQLRNFTLYRNISHDNIIYDYIKQIDRQNLPIFQQRYRLHRLFKTNSKAQRYYKQLRVDVRDKNYIWTHGMILGEGIDNGKHVVYVWMQGKSKKSYSTIYVSQNRIATFESYTNREQIPHYSNGKVIVKHLAHQFELVDWKKKIPYGQQGYSKLKK